MALPIVRNLQDCGDYAKTVEPFIDELYALPGAIGGWLTAQWHGESSIFDTNALRDAYLDTNPLVSGFAVSLALGAVFLVVSEFNRNYSQVDRCWSLLPTLYIAHFDLWARLSGLPSQRLDAVLLVASVWSARLTYNYARKGGYNVGSEDYRWAYLKERIPSWMFFFLNVTFISFIQSVLLFLLAAPTYILLLASTIEQELTLADIIFSGAELGLVALEWLADEQQWRFQAAKKQYQQTARLPPPLPGTGGRYQYTQEQLDRGFLTSGLWAYSRHPNFAAEQAVWLVLYQWSAYACGGLLIWSGVGAQCLVLLFQGSTAFTEHITAAKYPDYREYKKQVGMFVGLSRYTAPVPKPAKVIRTSDLAKRQNAKEAANAAATARATGVQNKSVSRGPKNE